MSKEDTFQAALPDSSPSDGSSIISEKDPETDEDASSIISEKDSYPDKDVASEDGVGSRTFQAALPDFIPSDGSYASSISYAYSEEEDSDSDTDENAVSLDPEDYNDRLLDIYVKFPKGVELFKLGKPSQKNWKLGWPMEGETTKSTAYWVNVYGFYNAETNEGGYGVILRNTAAEPIAASAYFSLYGVTYLYQVLMGIDAGLKLALKHGCSSPRVICNSGVAVRLFSRIASAGFCHKPNCSSIKVNNVCESCTMSMVPGMGSAYFKTVAPLIETLVQGKLHLSRFTKEPTKWNKAAYYLAKQAKKTLLVFGWGYRDYKVDIKPEDISDDLLDILWKDAYDSIYYNLDARNRIRQSGS